MAHAKLRKRATMGRPNFLAAERLDRVHRVAGYWLSMVKMVGHQVVGFCGLDSFHSVWSRRYDSGDASKNRQDVYKSNNNGLFSGAYPR